MRYYFWEQNSESPFKLGKYLYGKWLHSQLPSGSPKCISLSFLLITACAFFIWDKPIYCAGNHSAEGTLYWGCVISYIQECCLWKTLSAVWERLFCIIYNYCYRCTSSYRLELNGKGNRTNEMNTTYNINW